MSVSKLTQKQIIKLGNKDPINLPGEVWKSLESQGYSMYAVSNKGRIKNIKTSRIMKQFKTPDGYHYAHLNSNNERKYNPYIHVLVAKMFISNLENKTTVNHKNWNKSDNHVENLEWATPSEQGKHKRKKVNNHILVQDSFGRCLKIYNNPEEAKMEEKLNIDLKDFIHHCKANTQNLINGKMYTFLSAGILIPENQKEIWQKTPYENIPELEASNFGRVRWNMKLKNVIMVNGYLSVQFSIRKERIRIRLHKIISDTFLKFPIELKNLPESQIVINHKNGNKIDDVPENLEYSTRSQNGKHAFDTGLNKGSKKKIAAKNLITGELKYYKGIKETCTNTGYSRNRIGQICRAHKQGYLPTTKKYDFWYVDE